jgi:hypothetical protein
MSVLRVPPFVSGVRPVALALAALAVVLAFLAVVLALIDAARPKLAGPDPPKTVAQAVAKLEPMGLHVITADAHGELGDAAFLCDGWRNADLLRLLPRAPEEVNRWRGVVLIQRADGLVPPDDGSGCFDQVGPLALFGDPELVAHVAAALRSRS